MKIQLTASTAAKILIWREGELFHARLRDRADSTQVCLAVDLFEVIAELAGLDLERGQEAAEAMELAELARRELNLSLGSTYEAQGDDDDDLLLDGVT
jgi:hypothetical protein